VSKDRDRPPKPPKPDKGPRGRLDDAVALLGRSRLTYGEPVEAGGRMVIPVSRVRAVGGHGWGRGGDAGGSSGHGGGWGGTFDAQPVGFIDVGPDGSRFVEIPDPDRHARNLKAAATAATALLTGLAGARRLAGRGRARRQLRSGR